MFFIFGPKHSLFSTVSVAFCWTGWERPNVFDEEEICLFSVVALTPRQQDDKYLLAGIQRWSTIPAGSLVDVSGQSLINPVVGPVSRDNETTHLAAADRMKVASPFYVESRGDLTRWPLSLSVALANILDIYLLCFYFPSHAKFAIKRQALSFWLPYSSQQQVRVHHVGFCNSQIKSSMKHCPLRLMRV